MMGGRPVRHLLGRLLALEEPRQWQVRGCGSKGRGHHSHTKWPEAPTTRVALSWIMTRTAISISSSRTISTSIRRPHRCQNRALASTRAFWWRAGRPGSWGQKHSVPQPRRWHFRGRLAAGRHPEDRRTFGLGVAVFDYDNDGWPDIFVATTPPRPRFTKTSTTVRFRRSPSRPAWPIRLTASRKPAWASASRITIAMGISTL